MICDRGLCKWLYITGTNLAMSVPVHSQTGGIKQFNRYFSNCRHYLGARLFMLLTLENSRPKIMGRTDAVTSGGMKAATRKG